MAEEVQEPQQHSIVEMAVKRYIDKDDLVNLQSFLERINDVAHLFQGLDEASGFDLHKPFVIMKYVRGKMSLLQYAIYLKRDDVTAFLIEKFDGGLTLAYSRPWRSLILADVDQAFLAMSIIYSCFMSISYSCSCRSYKSAGKINVS